MAMDWISVKDRFPDKDQLVLGYGIYDFDGRNAPGVPRQDVVKYLAHGNFQNQYYPWYPLMKAISWMPLPEPPLETSKE